MQMHLNNFTFCEFTHDRFNEYFSYQIQYRVDMARIFLRTNILHFYFFSAHMRKKTPVHYGFRIVLYVFGASIFFCYTERKTIMEKELEFFHRTAFIELEGHFHSIKAPQLLHFGATFFL